MLPGKTWYWFWESENHDIPTIFTITDDGQIIRMTPGKPAQKWKLELRWVLDEGGHVIVPMDDHMMRGFFIPTGRQVGLFSENQQ